MAKKKKKSISAKRKKELKRVRQFISRAEKRGYRFDTEFKASIAKKTTRALQSLTPRKLYDLAKYEVLPGQFIPGKFGRWREREEAAKKGKETRERKKREREGYDYDYEDMPPAPPISDLIYQNVMDTIEEYPSSEGAQYLKNLIQSEINNYGFARVVAGMAAAGENLVKLAQEIVFYELNSQQLHEALQAFSQIIRGGIALTREESKALNETLESLGDES